MLRLGSTGSHPLRVTIDEGGDVVEVATEEVLVNQYPPTGGDPMLGGIFLRRIDEGAVTWAEPLVGSRSTSRVGALGPDGARWVGTTRGVHHEVCLILDPDSPAWTWSVALEGGAGATDATVFDLVCAQDVALAPPGAALSSEPYTSQYVAHRALRDPACGWVLASRQTMADTPRLPTLLTGWAEGARAFLTDGFDFFGLDAKRTGRARALHDVEWSSRNLQYEFAFPSLLSHAFTLVGPVRRHAFAHLLPHYGGDLEDLGARIGALRGSALVLDRGDAGPTAPGEPPSPAGAHTDTLLAGRPLSDDGLAALGEGVPRFVERDAHGHLLSLFDARGAHVVSAAKELACQRQHGDILRAGGALTPGRDLLSATVYMCGGFASHVVVGNTNMNRLVTVQRGALDLHRASGVRLQVRTGDGRWATLGLPSAFVMAMGSATWVYDTAPGRLVVTTTASATEPVLELALASDTPVDARFVVHLDNVAQWSPAPTPPADAAAGLTFTPRAGSELSRRCPGLAYRITAATPEGADVELRREGGTLVAGAPSTRGLRLRVRGGTRGPGDEGGTPTDRRDDLAAPRPSLVPTSRRAREGAPLDPGREVAAQGRALRDFAAGFSLTTASMPDRERAGQWEELATLVPWYEHDALVHFLAPHGLEQYSGAAWGTRDLCQGPFELCLAWGRLSTARDLVLRVLDRQFVDGGYPQWFMGEGYADIFQEDSHGDVPVWPLYSLAEYLEATGDTSVLGETVSYWDPETHRVAGRGSVEEHVVRLARALRHHCLPGTALPIYGEGDWDDTLQPADPAMKQWMSSSWTTALLFEATTRLAAVLPAGSTLARELADHADLIARDYREHLVADGVVAGYFAAGEVGASVGRHILHPGDTRTGIHYRLISMTRGIISGILTPEEALHHEGLIRRELHFPDGVRLMDRPAPYHDGTTRFFRRAEQAANVGREVGLMYTHAHIRYVEALAALGRPGAADELLRISPIGLGGRVPLAAPRQRNAYASSSDADFATRYDFAAHIEDLRAGRVATRAGWRIYSSGPGIFLRQLLQGVLGVGLRSHTVVLDPDLSPADDGLALDLEIGGVLRHVEYAVSAARDVAGCAVGLEAHRGGAWDPVQGTPLERPYRGSALEVALVDLEGTTRLRVTQGTPA